MKSILVNKKTRYYIQKRKEWRQRAHQAAIEFTTYPTGKPGREKVEVELATSIGKIRAWYRGEGRANRAINAIQHRAVNAFRTQISTKQQDHREISPC